MKRAQQSDDEDINKGEQIDDQEEEDEENEDGEQGAAM